MPNRRVILGLLGALALPLRAAAAPAVPVAELCIAGGPMDEGARLAVEIRGFLGGDAWEDLPDTLWRTDAVPGDPILRLLGDTALPDPRSDPATLRRT